ncbi:junctional adhesion molecule-like [Mastacembelus armatus]|uniref:junctional adhesion molecule-like n=1 Tax=Mastacembelus armatus TaxID=205130 RepID=UPI000E4651B5|nr:junctional adhesion molecule-like [Mastacembelus armatus]
MEKIILLMCLFLPFAGSPGADRLLCPKRVEAAVGLDVTLHCCLQTRQTPEVTFVQWTFNGSELVILYRSRAVSAEHIPAEQFKGRVSFSQRDKLNFSVTISAVQKTDQGIYSCKAGAKRRFTCETELLVGTGGERSTGFKLMTISCAGLVVLIFAVVLYVIYSKSNVCHLFYCYF